MGALVEGTATLCYAWALIPNHFHLLLRTGAVPIRHLYAAAADRPCRQFQSRLQRDHRRHGHLFQNRYKSILYQEDSYLLELVRYILLNPLRARLVAGMDALGKYPFCGHGVIMGKHARSWQEIDTVLAYFGKQVGPERRSYRAFVTKGIEQGRRWDLTGGGLIRSAGGWAAVTALKTNIKPYQVNKTRASLFTPGACCVILCTKSWTYQPLESLGASRSIDRSSVLQPGRAGALRGI
ncbi:MAG: hypothetical protein WBM78_20615 [Desulfobacterales bacterium]